MKLSILIVSWNTKALLLACLASLEQKLRGFPAESVETFVVDNASSDGSAQAVRDRFTWVNLIENGDNRGFAAGNNQAWSTSSGDYVLLLNPDTEVTPGAVSELVEFMDATPDAGAAGSRLLNADGTLQISSWPAPTLSRELWRLLHFDSLHPYSEYPRATWRSERPQQVDVVQGAAMIVRRNAVDDACLLDTDYFMYTEELDLCLRIRNNGWNIYWVPNSKVIHYGGQSTQQVREEMFLQLYRSKIAYFRKHQGPGAAIVYKAILVVASIVRLALSPLIALRRDSEGSRYRSLAWNYVRLIRSIGTL